MLGRARPHSKAMTELTMCRGIDGCGVEEAVPATFQTRRRRGRRGASALELAVLAVFWLPLLMLAVSAASGVFGGIETVQIARDAAHMYARGADLSQRGTREAMARLGDSMGLTPGPSGDGVIVLSTVMYVGRGQCRAYGLTGPDGNPDSRCANFGHFVLTHRCVVGNATLHSSRYGNPPAALVDARTGNINPLNYLSHPSARAGSFGALPVPPDAGAVGYRAGQPAFVAEVSFRARDLAGFGPLRESYAEVVF